MGFAKVWDPNVTSDGFTGFAQRRFAVRYHFFYSICNPILVVLWRGGKSR